MTINIPTTSGIREVIFDESLAKGIIGIIGLIGIVVFFIIGLCKGWF